MTERFEVLTVRDISFEDKKENRKIEGMQVWLLCESSDPSWNGWEVLKIWVDAKSSMAADAHQLRRGDHVQVSFGRNGRARTITLL